MQGRGNAAEIIAVGHDQQRHQADGGVLQGMNGTHEMQKAFFQPGADHVRNHIPEAFGFKDLRGRVQRHNGQQAVAGRGAFFIAGDPLGDSQSSPADQAAAQGAALPFPPGYPCSFGRACA